MNPLFSRTIELGNTAVRATDAIAHLFQLALRLYVAVIFFKSGLTKINDFSSTVALFESEYQVPLLSPTIAAVIGTGAELLLPLLLVVGLATRPTAVALFVFNIIAVISYPDISPAGVKDHLLWGTMLLVTLFFGAGKFSLDQLLHQKLKLLKQR